MVWLLNENDCLIDDGLSHYLFADNTIEEIPQCLTAVRLRKWLVLFMGVKINYYSNMYRSYVTDHHLQFLRFMVKPHEYFDMEVTDDHFHPAQCFACNITPCVGWIAESRIKIVKPTRD